MPAVSRYQCHGHLDRAIRTAQRRGPQGACLSAVSAAISGRYPKLSAKSTGAGKHGDSARIRPAARSSYVTCTSSGEPVPSVQVCRAPVAAKVELILPALSTDGSVYDSPRRRHATPPAALSTLGIKMAQRMTDSLDSLEDGSYDMVDDISEVSSDGHETVSIASTNDQDDEEEETQCHDRLGDVEQSPLLLGQQQAFKVQMPFDDRLGVDTTSLPAQADESTIDFDTPKQSITEHATVSQLTLRDLKLNTQAQQGQPSPLSVYLDDDYQFEKQSEAEPTPQRPKCACTECVSPKGSTSDSPISISLVGSLMSLLGLFVFIYLCSAMRLYNGFFSDDYQRTQALQNNLWRLPGLDRVATSINYTHIFPEREVIGRDMIGIPYYGTRDVRYQAVSPNLLLVALPEYLPGHYLQVHKVSGQRGPEHIVVNSRQLSGAAMIFLLEPESAYGLINISMTCLRPAANVTITHDFGSRFLHGSTYQKVGKDLSKAITKDIAIAGDIAKTLSTSLQTDLTGRLHNVSSMLRSAATDVSVFVNKTATTIHRTEQEGKELVLWVEQEVASMSKVVRHTFGSIYKTTMALVPTIKTFMQPLVASRERAATIANKLMRKERHLSSTVQKVRSRAKQIHQAVKADARALREQHKEARAQL